VALNLIRYTRQKIRYASKELQKLRTSDFATDDPIVALELIDADVFQKDLLRLASLKEEDALDVKVEYCLRANRNVARYERLLGFLIRSSNVRNPFAIFDPLLRLARSLLDHEAKLVLSSEWQFSPFTYPASFRELPNHVFIGLPATEASNSLILPLAGHELGHSVWRHKDKGIGPRCGAVIESMVRSKLQNRWSEFAAATGLGAHTLSLLGRIRLCEEFAKRQTEEVFCDILGVALFGMSYLHAFEYLVAPNIRQRRAPDYPALDQRVDYMSTAAQHFGASVPAEYGNTFKEDTGRRVEAERISQEIADDVVRDLASELIWEVDERCREAKNPLPSDSGRDKSLEEFRSLVPSADAMCIGDIVNAGWSLYFDEVFWESQAMNEDSRLDVLNDLVFKTLEVMEYETRQKEGDDTEN
jgi:hypothetical protein